MVVCVGNFDNMGMLIIVYPANTLVITTMFERLLHTMYLVEILYMFVIHLKQIHMNGSTKTFYLFQRLGMHLFGTISRNCPMSGTVHMDEQM